MGTGFRDQMLAAAKADLKTNVFDRRIEHLATQNEAARRLMQVEGVGPMTATAIVATIGEGHAFQQPAAVLVDAFGRRERGEITGHGQHGT